VVFGGTVERVLKDAHCRVVIIATPAEVEAG